MLNTCTFFSFGNFFVCSDYFFLYSACKDYLIFLGFKKIGHATVWCWLSFFLPMFCFWNSRSVIKVQKNYVIAAFVGRSHIDHLQEDKTIFVCYFYHLFDGMRFDTRGCLHYNKRVSFQMCHDGNSYKTKKCFQCYRRSIKSLLKYYLRFIC